MSHADAADDDVIEIEVVHDAHGTTIGLSACDLEVLLSADEAEQIALSLLRAAAIAGTWAEARARLN